MIETYDNRPVKDLLFCPFFSVYPKCRNCGEILDWVPNRIGGVDRPYWGHMRFTYHKDCPLYADVSLRPNVPTRGEPLALHF
jgi:hypothetical protein